MGVVGAAGMWATIGGSLDTNPVSPGDVIGHRW